MKIAIPKGEIAFLTVAWILLAASTLWTDIQLWIDVQIGPLSWWWGGLMVAAVIASTGIWLGIKPAGYAFAAVNLVAAICSVLLISGLIGPESWAGLSVRAAARTAVLIYCAVAGIRWARSSTNAVSKTAT